MESALLIYAGDTAAHLGEKESGEGKEVMGVEREEVASVERRTARDSPRYIYPFLDIPKPS